MGIATQAQAGVQIQSPAKNGTLTSQGTLTGSNIFLPGDLTANNGQMGNTDYTGRILVLRRGLANEEIRYIIGPGSTGAFGWQLQVNEPWVQAPASGDAYAVSYILADAATVTGLSYAAKADSYTSGRRLDIQNTGLFAFRDGDMFETNDNSSTTVADVTVSSGGLLVVGYETGGSAVSGAFAIGTPATDGELVLDVKAGGVLVANDLFFRCVKRNKTVLAGTVFMRRTKLYKAVAGADFTGVVTMRDSVIEGVGDAGDTILVDDSIDFDSVQLTNTAGFTFPAATITVVISNLTFINNIRVADLQTNNTLILVDAVGAVDLASTFYWTGTTSNSVEWKYSFDSTVADSDGVAIANAGCYIYEGLLNQNIPQNGYSDGGGIFSRDILTNIYTGVTPATSNSAEAPRGQFRFHVYKYGYGVFATSLAATAPEERPAGLVLDSVISGINEATALAVTGVVITDHRSAPLSAQSKSWSWEIDCGGNSLLDAYANLRARFAADPATQEALILAAIGENQHFMENESGAFVTKRFAGNGVYLSNFSGNPGYMTADDGTTYTPPISRAFTFNVQDASGAVINYEWRLYEDDATPGVIGSVELDGEENRATSSYVYNYNWTADQDVILQIIKDGYQEFLGAYTLQNADQTITAILQDEVNV